MRILVNSTSSLMDKNIYGNINKNINVNIIENIYVNMYQNNKEII